MPKHADQSKFKSPAKQGQAPPDKIKKEILFFCSCCAAVIVLLITGINLQSYLTPNQVLGTKAEVAGPSENEQEKIFWENFLKDNPRYFDGWLELARIYDEEGNLEAKEKALNYAREINPNSPVFLR